MTTQPDETQLEEGADPSHRGMALVLVVVSFVVFALVGELIMRVLSENPYRNESTDYLIKLQIHHTNRDMTFDRSVIDSEKPTSRFRTNDRSYNQKKDCYEQFNKNIFQNNSFYYHLVLLV